MEKNTQNNTWKKTYNVSIQKVAYLLNHPLIENLKIARSSSLPASNQTSPFVLGEDILPFMVVLYCFIFLPFKNIFWTLYFFLIHEIYINERWFPASLMGFISVVYNCSSFIIVAIQCIIWMFHYLLTLVLMEIWVVNNTSRLLWIMLLCISLCLSPSVHMHTFIFNKYLGI